MAKGKVKADADGETVVAKADKVDVRAGLRNMWAWYLARGLVMKIVIGFVALMLVVAPFTGEDTDSVQAGASAAEAEASEEADAAAEAKAKAAAKAKTAAKAAARAAARRAAAAGRAARTYLVTRVIDGDTIELGDGGSVRIVGIDTPERGECGFDTATANMHRLVLGKRVRLTMSDEDTDRYGRLLRYVDVGKRDAGLAQINAGLAIARYDSRDGYGFHPRENRYIAADKATPDKTTCPKPKPVPNQNPSGGSSVYYENCTAARDAGAAPVRRGDPGYGTHLDRDGDGVGCE